MIDWLENIDHQIVLFVNGLHAPFFDEFMWLMSDKIIWIPFYLILLFILYRKNGLSQMFVFLACAISLVFFTDFLSVHAFKDVFLRYRPSHNLLLKNQLHLYPFENGKFYEGGLYGFISSHAANFSAIVTFFVLSCNNLKGKWFYFIPVIVVGYSRIYLGVHYLSDVLIGYVFGAAIAICIHKFVFQPLIQKLAFTRN